MSVHSIAVGLSESAGGLP